MRVLSIAIGLLFSYPDGRLHSSFYTLGQTECFLLFDCRWLDFVLEMFRATGSDFDFLTSEIDQNAKNQPAPNCSYKGLDPATGVPIRNLPT
jgi:hypothetical protein